MLLCAIELHYTLLYITGFLLGWCCFPSTGWTKAAQTCYFPYKNHSGLISVHMIRQCLIAVLRIVLVDGQMLKMALLRNFRHFSKLIAKICTVHVCLVIVRRKYYTYSHLWLTCAAFWNSDYRLTGNGVNSSSHVTGFFTYQRCES